MDIRIRFLGAAGTVTGSKYLLEIDDHKIMVDCGLFQGLKELRLKNREDFPVNPKEIEAIVLTHAHLDHSGYLPKLCKEGFSGPIYCTEATADLVKLLLLDSAKLMEEEADYAKKKGYSKHENPEPLYRTEDVERVLPLLRKFPFKKQVSVIDRVQSTFYNAGHILGASSVELEVTGIEQKKKLVFSGDIGRYEEPILYEPDVIKEADILLIESTYGNRKNPQGNPVEKLAEAINKTFDRGGCVMIPAFAVGRTQNLLYYLKEALDQKLIPEVPVFMDSPMAIAATELYVNHAAYHKLSAKDINEEDSFLSFRRNLQIVRSHEASMSINYVQKDAIIVSASGMMTGGRILHHLYNRLPHKNDTLLLVGYQAEGTRGRKIANGEETIKIFGQMVPVNCEVVVIDGLSAHADQDELLRWTSSIEKHPKRTFIVHGEKESATVFSELLNETYGWNTEVPAYLDSYELFKGI